jgi:hypothetical protein
MLTMEQTFESDIIQSHTTGEGQSGIVGGYVRPPVISKQGGRPDSSGHAFSVDL